MNPLDLYIDPDISRASTLPATIYADQEIFKASLDKIFACTWQIIDAETNSQENIYPFLLLEGSLNEPLILVRKDTGWTCMSNVCTHRGNVLITKPGKYSNLVCGYHGKCFDLNGKYKSMPAFDQAADFPSVKDDLPNLPHNRFGPLHLTSISPSAGFEEVVAPLAERMSWFPFDSLQFAPELTNTYQVDVNWALYCENYLEGFHIPFVHERLNKTLKFSDYTTELFDYCNLQLGVAREGEAHFDIPDGHQDSGKKILAYYWWIFPNIMINIYTWGMSLNIVKPQGVEKTAIVFKTYLLPGVEEVSSISAELDNTEMEDESIVKNVQVGVRSRLYTQGRFSPTLEKGVHHFQSLLVKYLQK